MWTDTTYTDRYTGDWIQITQQKMQWQNFDLHNSKYFSVFLVNISCSKILLANK